MDRLIHSAPPFAEVLPRFLQFVGDLPLVAHNGARLDMPFLLQNGFPPECPFLDTVELAFLALPAAPRHNLRELAEAVGLDPDAPEVMQIVGQEPRVAGTTYHNALYDSAMLSLIVGRLLGRLDGAVASATPYGLTLASRLPDLFPEASLPAAGFAVARPVPRSVTARRGPPTCRTAPRSHPDRSCSAGAGSCL